MEVQALTSACNQYTGYVSQTNTPENHRILVTYTHVQTYIRLQWVFFLSHGLSVKKSVHWIAFVELPQTLPHCALPHNKSNGRKYHSCGWCLIWWQTIILSSIISLKKYVVKDKGKELKKCEPVTVLLTMTDELSLLATIFTAWCGMWKNYELNIHKIWCWTTYINNRLCILLISLFFDLLSQPQICLQV